ncbi:MAG: WYL domain-containing protein [Hydrogenophaga sp.]|uniref:helix-turn-helix transcriptional regulator n=1 Tax=Hydrogenophaga sp. TaxID=1904254 RepID=UPI0025BBD077|nr:WYL domain-containing protein [Hydrogenophaga sp.]MBU7574492.1 WYL domain-containing protein [Hydrogenophaga sp.]
MQASRLLSILMLLQARGRLTAGALAQALEVSERTVLRDIDQLSAAGVPLWGERGRQGGFQLREGWSTQLTGMTEPEARALLLAGLPGPATELGLGAAAASARLKMVASLPGEWREQADRVGQRLHIDPVDWYRAQDAPNFLREVADAVWRARRIEVRYESWRGKAWRTLEPLGLVLKAGAWYLVARAVDAAPTKGDGARTYRLASLLELKPGTAFRRPKTFDLARTWQASAARFESELRSIEVRARATPRCLKWLANARVPFSDPVGDEVTIRVESVEQGARQLLAFGDEIEVLSPPALRERLAQQAAAVLASYQAPGRAQC